MSDMERLNEQALETVTGGEDRVVHNDAVNYANVRRGPGLNADVFFRIDNGQHVETTGTWVDKDGYRWYEIRLAGAYELGWIAGSLIGF